MAIDKDPAPDLYVILDRAKLTPSHVLTARQSTTKTVEEIRSSIVQQVSEYIKAREADKELNHGTQGQ